MSDSQQQVQVGRLPCLLWTLRVLQDYQRQCPPACQLFHGFEWGFGVQRAQVDSGAQQEVQQPVMQQAVDQPAVPQPDTQIALPMAEQAA
jgi:hypothetical protein